MPAKESLHVPVLQLCPRPPSLLRPHESVYMATNESKLVPLYSHRQRWQCSQTRGVTFNAITVQATIEHKSIFTTSNLSWVLLTCHIFHRTTACSARVMEMGSFAPRIQSTIPAGDVNHAHIRIQLVCILGAHSYHNTNRGFFCSIGNWTTDRQNL